MRRTAFPEAPVGSYVSPEGWLIVNDEAWTAEEWASKVFERPRNITNGRPRQYDDERHRKDREYHRRKRSAA